MAMLKFDISKTHTFDLECTTSEPAHCWLAASTPLASPTLEDTVLFRDVGSLVNYIFHRSHHGHRFYAHNLSYDMSFILAYLRERYDGHYEITRLVCPPMGGLMQITIRLFAYTVYFFDSYVKFSAPLAKVLESYTDMRKGDTPIYERIEDVVHNDYNDLYCKIDACGLALALPQSMEMGSSLTVPSDAYKRWRNIMANTYGTVAGRYTPIDIETDTEMRQAYRGGFTYVNGRYQGKELENVKRYDVNSMYPAQMRLKLLPHGRPLSVKTGAVVPVGFFKLGIQKMSFKFAEVRQGFVPFVATKRGFNGYNLYGDVVEPKAGASRADLYLTLEEFELFKESYHIEDLKLEGGWMFMGADTDFEEYIDEFWEMKSSRNPTIKNRGKLFLNSLYGKFAENPVKQEMYLDDEEPVLRFRPTGVVTERPVGYLPMGIFITSYARVQLIRSILSVGYENFVYADTDSMHLLEGADVSKLDVDPERIGAWDYEGTFTKAKYLRAKRYMGIESDGKAKVVCAGISIRDLKEQVKTLDEFYIGRKINTVHFTNGTRGKYVRKHVTHI